MVDLPIKSTREIYSAAIEILGMKCLTKIYGNVNQRNLYRYAADPDFCEDTARNPIDRILIMMRSFNAMGHHGVSRALASMVCQAAGTTQQIPADPNPDKATLAEECLDDLPYLAEYHRILNNPDSPETQIRQAKEQLIKELDENEQVALTTHKKGAR